VFRKSNNSYTEDHGCLIYIEALFRYAMVLTGNRTDAEDLVQETYFRSLRTREGFVAGINRKSWIFAILRNAWLNQPRERRDPPVATLLDGATADCIVETSIDSHERLEKLQQREHVQEAILKLPLYFREVVILREYEDLSYEEIAAVLDIPQGTVMSRLRGARVKLLHLLSNNL
jgi:RNA polymerase sigma-70 factor, ECF subfamily